MFRALSSHSFRIQALWHERHSEYTTTHTTRRTQPPRASPHTHPFRPSVRPHKSAQSLSVWGSRVGALVGCWCVFALVFSARKSVRVYDVDDLNTPTTARFDTLYIFTLKLYNIACYTQALCGCVRVGVWLQLYGHAGTQCARAHIKYVVHTYTIDHMQMYAQHICVSDCWPRCRRRRRCRRRVASQRTESYD